MAETEGFNQALRKNAIIYGVILGIIVLGLSIFSFYFITSLTKTWGLIIAGPYLFAIVIPLLIIILFCFTMRKAIGGCWSFKQAVTAIFIMLLVNFAVLSIGRDVIFAKLVEPQMVQKTEAVMLNVKASSLKAGGLNQNEVNKQVYDLKKEFDLQNNPGVGSILQNYIFNIIFLFVLALVFSSIFKKEPARTNY